MDEDHIPRLAGRLSVTPDIEPERQPPTGGRGRDSSSSHSDSLAGHRFRGPDTTPPPIAAGGTTRGCEAIVHAKNTTTRDDASGPWTWSAPTTGSTGPASCVRSDECPRKARYCELCCSNDSLVLFGPERIPSKRVVQQGDLLGPLLFALGLHGATSEGGAFVEAINSPVDMSALLTTEPSARQRRLPSLWIILRRPA